jgi:hypothetical protein
MEVDVAWQLDQDTKNILFAMLNCEDLLRLLTISPQNPRDDVTAITTARPSITGTKSISQRANEFYFTEGQPVFINAINYPDEDTKEKGRVCFYAGRMNFKNIISPQSYVFDIYLPYSWHRYNNGCYKAMREIVMLFKRSQTFGDLCEVSGSNIIPIATVPKFVGYRMEFTNFNYTGW